MVGGRTRQLAPERSRDRLGTSRSRGDAVGPKRAELDAIRSAFSDASQATPRLACKTGSQLADGREVGWIMRREIIVQAAAAPPVETLATPAELVSAGRGADPRGAAMDIGSQFHAEIVRPGEHVVVLALEGDVDIYAAAQFKALLMRGIAEGAHPVIVDLARATYLDSTALGVLVSAAKRAAKGSLAIVCGDELRRILIIVGLERIFTLYASRSAALAAVASQSTPLASTSSEE
jgi:anti-sigma B factor antagonist